MKVDVPHRLHTAAAAAQRTVLEAEADRTEAAKAVAAHPTSQQKRQTLAHAEACAAVAREEAKTAQDAASYAPRFISEQWFPVLTGVFGDTPFAAKLRRSVGSTAHTGCPRCNLLGSKRKPETDGSPGEEKLKAVSFGGVACNARAIKMTTEQTTDAAGEPVTTYTEEEVKFCFCDDSGRFNQADAHAILIDDPLDEMLAAIAEDITEDHRRWYRVTLQQKVQALTGDESAQERSAGMRLKQLAI